MKTLKFLLLCIVALLAIVACEKNVEESAEQNQNIDESIDDNQNSGDNENPDSGSGREPEYDEEYYAKLAWISCADERFSFNYSDNSYGGNILFDVFGGEVIVDVNCGTAWIAENNAEDTFSCTINSSSINITAGQNYGEDELSGAITLMTAEKRIVFAIITIIQDGVAYINLSDEDVVVSSFGSSISVTVESNFDWEYAYESDWLTVTKDEKNSSMTIEYMKNETEDCRECVVVVTAGDGAKNTAVAELKITQSWENFDALILEYTITSNNVSIQLPISSVSNATIDWDDGSTEITSTSNPSHTYSTPGIYVIYVNGDIKRLISHDSFNIRGIEYLTAIKQWGDISPTRMDYAFRGCSNLVSIPEGAGPFSEATTFYQAFYNCSSLVSAPLFEGYSKSTNFSYCFYGCENLANLPDNMFSGCSSATDFSYCFNKCKALTILPDNMFSGCSSATDFSHCFEYCYDLTTLGENMFSGCSSVLDFKYCFHICSSLTSLPENLFSDCSLVTDFKYCFSNCSALKTIPVSLFDNSFSVTSFDDTFYDCLKMEGESPYTEVEIEGNIVKVHLYDRSDYATKMRWTSPTGLHCFYYCKELSDYDSMPSSWKSY